MPASNATATQPGSAAAVLAAVRERRATENRAAADVLSLAAEWADLHPPESMHHAAGFTVPGCEHEEPLAGPGTPLVAEFCCAELGAVLGVSTTAAKKLMGNALELRHRLPRLWKAVHAGRVPAWRARLVAEATAHASPALSIEAAGWVDSQVAAVAGKIGAAQLDRLVIEAVTRHGLTHPMDLNDDPDDDRHYPDRRHVTVDKDHVHFTGTMRVEAELALADALDLDHTLTHHAATLKALGSSESLDARRAVALGHLARTQTSLDLAGLLGHDSSVVEGRQARHETPGTNPAGVKLPAARQLVLHLHLTAAATGEGGITFDHLGRMEEGHRLLLLDQIRSWCADSHTKVVLKPVIDLNQPRRAHGYAIPDRIRDHVILRDQTCVFPHCTRPARRCQVDHITPYDHDAATEGRPQPGPTSTDNLAALCTFHHRLKTHTGWRYTMVEPGVFEWTSPYGHHYLRDREGTSTLTPPGFETGLRPPSTGERHRRH